MYQVLRFAFAKVRLGFFLIKAPNLCFFLSRFLDPDLPYLLAELNKSMGKKFHQLNKAITTLVGVTSSLLANHHVCVT